MPELFTAFVAEVYLQAGYRAGIAGDSGKLTALHGPGGTFICTMVETVVSGDVVVVEQHGNGVGSVGRNAKPEELQKLRDKGIEV